MAYRGDVAIFPVVGVQKVKEVNFLRRVVVLKRNALSQKKKSLG